MRLHRFYTSELQMAKNKPSDRVSITDSGLIHQWRDVFRYTVGGQVRIFDGLKNEYLALIEKITEKEATLVLLERITAEKPKKNKANSDALDKSKSANKSNTGKKAVKSLKNKVYHKGNYKQPELWLIQSMLKGDHFDMVVEKATELGVSTIVPCVSERTIKMGINKDRLQKIAIEASEQCGRRDVPAIFDITSLQNAVSNYIQSNNGLLYVCNAGGKSVEAVKKEITRALSSRSSQSASSKSKQNKVAILVGPEGGWSPKELEYFESNKISSISLGDNVLRAETAAIVGVYALLG